MNDRECEGAFQQLETAMNDAGLSWVTTQVNEEIRFGRILTKKVRSRTEISDDLILVESRAPVRRSKVEVSATRPFTSPEKLGLLISALNQAVAATNDMQEAVRHRLQAASGNTWKAIRLIRSDEPTPGELVVDATADEQRSGAVKELRRLTQLLMERI